jgi:hypothetical protein
MASCDAGKLLAFSGPSNVARVYYGFKSFTPDDYVEYFRQRGVSAVVRLNKPVSTLFMMFCNLEICAHRLPLSHAGGLCDVCHAICLMQWQHKQNQ